MASATIARALSRSPDRTRSGRGPSSRRTQSTESLRNPARCSRCRASPSNWAKGSESVTALRRQAGPEPGRERRAQPARRHRDGHRAVAVDRREDEGAVREVVGAVDPDTGGLGVGVDRAVDFGIAGGGDDQAERRRVARA